VQRIGNSIKQQLRGQHYNNLDAGAARQQQLLQLQYADSPSNISLDLQTPSWQQQHQEKVLLAESQGENTAAALMSTMQHPAQPAVEHAAGALGLNKPTQLPVDMHTHTDEGRTQQSQGQQDAWLDSIREDITSWRKLQSEHIQSARRQLTMQDSQQLRLVQDSLFEAAALPQPGPEEQGSALLWGASQQQSQQGVTTSQADVPRDTAELVSAAAPAAQAHTAQQATLAWSSSAQNQPHKHLAAAGLVQEWPPVPPAAPTPSSMHHVEHFMSEEDYSMAFTGVSSKHQHDDLVGASDTSTAAQAAAYSQDPEGAGFTGDSSTGLASVDAASDDMTAEVREQRPVWATEVLDRPAGIAPGVLCVGPQASRKHLACFEIAMQDHMLPGANPYKSLVTVLQLSSD
jgi:hypothetical protein